jgi:hypothetical protein
MQNAEVSENDERAGHHARDRDTDACPHAQRKDAKDRESRLPALRATTSTGATVSTRLSTVIHGPAGREILAGLSVDTSFAVFTPLDEVYKIVTDAIGAEDRARLEESGVDVPVAG